MANNLVRKCWLSIKLCLLLVGFLYLMDQWFGDVPFEEQIRKDDAEIIPGLGEGGYPVSLNGSDKWIGEKSHKNYGMNVYLSDQIPYNRTIKDNRHPLCLHVVYDAELPSASVILAFRDEPYSVLLRTIWSVLNSVRRDQPWYKPANITENGTSAIVEMGYKGQPPDSPYVYLKEIILVDDNSNLSELKGKLSFYIKTRLPSDMIRILRLPEWSGLIRARQAGFVLARGDVIVSLDAHCEPLRDWLRPLLHRIKQKRTAVVTPVIDTLDTKNFGHNSLTHSESDICVGGFTFDGKFIWEEKKKKGSDISPTWSPTMAGGLFAMDLEYYWELGGYDVMMSGYRGENLEMSFRVWQCGGTLEIIPCSRVGHVPRRWRPYKTTPGINTARVAEVWMDEYAELYYMYRPDLRNNPIIGDITQRKALREKLQCKSFQWYLDNIYPEQFVPIRDDYAYGRVLEKLHSMCLDTRRPGSAPPLTVFPCHVPMADTQFFSLTLDGHLRGPFSCAEVGNDGNDTDGRLVYMRNCREPQQATRRQLWSYSEGIIKNVGSELCLTAGAVTNSSVLAKRCDGSPEQKWTIDYSQENGYNMASDNELSDRESFERQAKLRKLRRHRSVF